MLKSLLIAFVFCFNQSAFSDSQTMSAKELKKKMRYKKESLGLGFGEIYNSYGGYDLSEFKEKKLQESIRVIYDYDESLKCRALGKINTQERLIANYKGGKTECENVLNKLMDYAERKGANAIYLSIIPRDCKIRDYRTFALRC